MTEEQAFELLQWLPYSLPTPFDENLALQGHYTKLQRQRSDKALDRWEADNPYEQSDELRAFHKLNDLGILTQKDFYSPSLAKDGHYLKALRSHCKPRVRQGAGEPESPRYQRRPRLQR